MRATRLKCSAAALIWIGTLRAFVIERGPAGRLGAPGRAAGGWHGGRLLDKYRSAVAAGSVDQNRGALFSQEPHRAALNCCCCWKAQTGVRRAGVAPGRRSDAGSPGRERSARSSSSLSVDAFPSGLKWALTSRSGPTRTILPFSLPLYCSKFCFFVALK